MAVTTTQAAWKNYICGKQKQNLLLFSCLFVNKVTNSPLHTWTTFVVEIDLNEYQTDLNLSAF